MSQNKKKLQLNFETIGSIAAIVIGASALYVAWDQAQVMRAQQHASVIPLLSSDFSVDQDEDGFVLELQVINKGVGPALVESAQVTVDGKVMQTREAYIRAVFSDTRPAGTANIIGSDIEQGVIGSGDQTTVFRVKWPKDDQNTAAFTALAKRYVGGDGPTVSVSTCYCSVFDRCYASNGGARAETVRACPPPTNMFATLLGDNQANQ